MEIGPAVITRNAWEAICILGVDWLEILHRESKTGFGQELQEMAVYNSDPSELHPWVVTLHWVGPHNDVCLVEARNSRNSEIRLFVPEDFADTAESQAMN